MSLRIASMWLRRRIRSHPERNVRITEMSTTARSITQLSRPGKWADTCRHVPRKMDRSLKARLRQWRYVFVGRRINSTNTGRPAPREMRPQNMRIPLHFSGFFFFFFFFLKRSQRKESIASWCHAGIQNNEIKRKNVDLRYVKRKMSACKLCIMSLNEYIRN